MNQTPGLSQTDSRRERQMLLNRIGFAILSGGGSYILALDGRIYSAFFLYLVANMTLFVMQRYDISRKENRWLATIMFDAILAFTVMQVAPEQMSIFYPLLLWAILSNGFRYGVNWLLAASIAATVSFGAVVLTTGYWQQNLTLGLVLTVALVAIPAYCSTLIRNISRAKKQADLASKAKSYFLASVSHELRTPLNAIIGYGNHLRQSNMSQSQKDMVEASVLAGEHLLLLIEQLIDVARTGTGKTEVIRTTFRATDLLAEIRDIMIGRVEDKGLALRLQAEPLSDYMVEGPVSVIRNILLNLVGNAAKFTEAGTITISCGTLVRNDKTALWFTVSDTGIGICETAVDRIFQPFQQADETVMNRFGGTGLGLSICKQLTEQVDGNITVESQIGQGSIFRIEIPIQPIQTTSEFDDLPADVQIGIMSFGTMSANLLANAQAQENFNVHQVECEGRAGFLEVLADLDLTRFQVALIPEHLIQAIAPDDSLWTKFADAGVAPILVREDDQPAFRFNSSLPLFTSAIQTTASFEEIRSAVKIGCAFARKARLSNVERTAPPVTYAPRRVLVADDNRTNRNVLAAILEAAGHYVSMAADGDEALIELEKGETDILLLDVNMPRLSGIDACKIWRQRENGANRLPIIGVTADATLETEAKCLAAGMDLRITKPVNARLLLSSIEKYCEGATAPPELEAVTTASPSAKVVPITRDILPPSEAIDATQIQYLRSIGDQAFVNTMIDGFLEDIEQTLEPMRRSVKIGDVSEFRFCAHAFKSSGNNMGAASLTRLCAQLEKISEADFAEQGHDYLVQIEEQIAAAVTALKTDVYSVDPIVVAQTG
ncbi:ATP-binding protein [Sphingorhabdus sp.]|uniref:ATP-binding protein n=1 Tax=Sphingorhabdus sp. TaxID=1902408 RepID=UPI00391AD16E